MAEREPDLSGARALAGLYEAKALAELADVETLLPSASKGWSGKAQSSLALVVGPAFPGEGAGVAALGETVGEALGKALTALGAAPADVFIISSRPVPDAPKRAVAGRLELAIEAVDPRLVFALDAGAAEDLATAFGTAALEPGVPVRARGRVLGSVGDFAASLAEPGAKAGVWSAMKSVAAEAGFKAKGRPKASQKVPSHPAGEKD